MKALISRVSPGLLWLVTVPLTMKYFFLCLCLFLAHAMANAQTVNGNRIVWGPTPIEARLSYGFESIGFDVGKFSYTGIEQGVFLLSNKTGHTLFVKLTCYIRDYCGKTYSYNLSFTVKANETTKETLSPDASPCVSVKKLSERFSTVISTITVDVNSVVDLTEEAETKKREQEAKEKERIAKEKQAADAREKERIAKEKQAADAKEKERIAKEKQAADARENTQPQSYYGNQQKANPEAATTQSQPTWQETNDRIAAENQQRYAQQQQQQQQIAENTDAIVSGVFELGETVVNFINQNREQKEEREEREAERQRQEQERKRQEQEEIDEIAHQKTLRLELRKSFFIEYPEGSVPLSSQKIPVNVLYYFTYMFDKGTIANERPEITLSNIFQVARYADGTWPFKNSIVTDLKKLNAPGDITLVGYFETLELAGQWRNSFLDRAGRSEFVINNITYKGKVSTGAAEGADFWGTGDKTSKTDDDFWGEDKKEKAKPVTEKEDDFWGDKKEPVKTVAPKKATTPKKPAPKT